MATKKKPDGRKQISLWVTAADLRRADALVPKLAKDPIVASIGEITRSAVLRHALARGLESLEAEHGGK